MGARSLSPQAQEFLGLSTRGELARWLKLTDRELRYVLYALTSEQKYTSFNIRKKNGCERVIDAPHPALKALQRKLLSVFSEIAHPTGLAKGYVQGRSVIDHAWLHRRKRFVILADLQDFFPSITFPRVRGALMAKPFCLPPVVATCVAQLCCKDGTLPQGAPTSPALSNLICRSLDHSLLRLAKKHRFAVSRYADDICLSTSQRTIPIEIAVPQGAGFAVGAELNEIVQSSGFHLNEAKFKVRGRETRQLVTGLVVNQGVSLPREWRRQLRVLLHMTRKHGAGRAAEIAASWERPPASRQGFRSLEQVIRGKSHFAQFVDQRCERGFSDSLFRSYESLRSLLPRPLAGVPLRLMAEGKTDLLHLEAAFRELSSAGEFSHLRPRFVNFSGETGDIELLKTLRRIAKSDIPELTIGIFDCDNPKFMKKEGLSAGEYVQLGSNVFALCLAEPPGLEGKQFCIELLYDRDALCAVTPESRRVFMGDEFDRNTGVSHDGAYRRDNPAKAALIVGDKVTRMTDGRSSALSKWDLATLVHQKAPPFSDIVFDGFRPTFALIESIADVVNGR